MKYINQNSMSAVINFRVTLALSLSVLISCGGSGGGGGGGGNSDSSGGTKNPLLSYQWYYENTGQKVFSKKGGVSNKDLDVASVHASGITGKGVRVMIVDDGLDMKHEDLSTDYTNSYNILTKSNDPTPVYYKNAHGTSVAGIINMQDNFVGGLGIAPGTVLRGGNLLGKDVTGDRGDYTGAEYFYMQGLAENPEATSIKVNNNADIFNNSFGTASCSPVKFDDVIYGYYKNAHDGRNGKGYVYVKTAGNGFSSYGKCKCDDANAAGISCQNANRITESAIPEFIIVGAFNADGKITSYSSHGSNLWVTAPGGEFGFQEDREIENPKRLDSENGKYYPFREFFYKPAMLTTDPTGCVIGYSRENSVSVTDFNYNYDSGSLSNFVLLFSGTNDLLQNIIYPDSSLFRKVGPYALNLNCNYNSTMNGTSSAAPSTTGVVALMLEANPELTWRDVKHVLAVSSINDIEDNTLARQPIDLTTDGKTYTIDAGWIENKAGNRFSNTYGFGNINAKKAVDAAKNYKTGSLGTYASLINDVTTDKNISKNGTIVSTTDVSSDLIIEHVRIELTLTHADVRNVMLRLKSPQGTESILYWPKSGYSDAKGGFDNFSLAGNAFYGESSKGTWTLTINDINSDITADGKLSKWKMEINGHPGDGNSNPSSGIKNPLLPYQWYYENTGQKVFSGKGGVSNKDLNVASVHASGITGKGVRVMIVDDGLDMKHEDLNTDYTNSYNILTKSNDPTPVYYKNAHGTSVAGIINMQDNFVGGLGIAPGTVLSGGNYLGKDVTGDRGDSTGAEYFYMQGVVETPESNTIKANNIADVFNNSFVVNSCSPIKFNDVIYSYFKKAHEGRNGKGYVYVKSAGNGFSSYGICKCDDAKAAGISCQNANSNTETVIPEFIIVGAGNADGKIASYSSHGSNLWVTAPGGEFGFEENRAVENPKKLSTEEGKLYIWIDNYYKPAMLTTDPTGCVMGYSRDNSISVTDFNYNYDSGTGFDYVVLYSGTNEMLKKIIYPESSLFKKVGPYALNPNCNYNSTMNGTSSAAPSTTGVVALMLEANPELTWRDVKHVLAVSSINDIEDNTLARQPVNLTSGGKNYTIDAGWIENKAGYRFSNTYGFGNINAKKAVDAAKNYKAGSLGTYASLINDVITSKLISKNGAIVSTTDATSDLIIEHVRIELTLTHLDVGNVLLRLKSPQGTESILYWPKSGFSGAKGGFDNYSLAGSAFYGELSKGIWTLTINDINSDITADGKLSKWKMEINGHPK